MKTGQYLISVDLEGIHGIVGEPYKGLNEAFDYELAIENATQEINAVVAGLFDGGADLVAVWDCHGSGVNLDFSKIDQRVIRVENPAMAKYERLSFAKKLSFDGILYIGYHAKAGSLNGVLAHTYSSKTIQYYKINGMPVGEIEMDTWGAGEYGITPLFCASDDICVNQAKDVFPAMRTVITKYGTGRNSAHFREKGELLKEIYEQAKACVGDAIQPQRLQFPATLEVRFTRLEDAVKRFERVRGYGQVVEFGEDGHVLVAKLNTYADLESFM